MDGLKPGARVSLKAGHPWRFYGPALVLVTSPVFDAAKRYTESTPLAPGELARDLAIVVLVTLGAVLAAALLPGSHRMKGAVFTLTLLVGTGYPALAAAAGVGPCTWGDTALGLSFLACIAIVTVLWLRRAPKVLESLNGALWLTAGISLLISSQTAWAQFARTGDPGWKRFDTTTRATMMLDRECRVANDPGRAGRLAQGGLPSP